MARRSPRRSLARPEFTGVDTRLGSAGRSSNAVILKETAFACWNIGQSSKLFVVLTASRLRFALMRRVHRENLRVINGAALFDDSGNPDNPILRLNRCQTARKRDPESASNRGSDSLSMQIR